MARTHGTRELWLSALRADGQAMRLALEQVAAAPEGLATSVPSRPGWRVLDLIHHVGARYREVRSHVSRGVTSRPEELPSTPPPPPDATAIQWWAEEHEQLLQLLESLDPHQPAWNWAPRPKDLSFWQRRMAHFTAVHRWDAQTAAGRVEPIEAKLAADGVTEVLDTLLPAGRRRDRTERFGVVHLVATDPDHEWFVRLRGSGLALLDTGSWLDHEDPQARAQARGTASDLVLALSGRVPFDVLEVSGEVELLESLRVADDPRPQAG
ncbi:MAG: maleylpyruvate isomerase family mycothiol-dependent enzyme [Micromonosporaceae bacterium]|jgi:uncharacterized protein (TIGR03083 family)